MALRIPIYETRVCRTNKINTQKRHTHKTKSYEYAKKYFKKKEDADQFLKITKESNVHMFPKTVTAILKAESTFADQGLFTGVHATPAVFTPAIHLATQCELTKNKSAVHKNIDTFAITRDPESLNDHYTQMMHILQVLNDKCNDKPDWVPLMGDKVKSINYGLFTNLERGESAFYYGFKNRHSRGRADADFAKKKVASMVERTLKHYGFADKEIKEIVNSKELNELLAAFHSLTTGNFLIFGIPREIARKSVYDSLPFGIPTGQDVLEVYDGTAGNDRIRSHQARLVLSKETKDTNSGIFVLSGLNEDHSIDPHLMKFKQTAFIPPYAIKEFQGILPVGNTEIENDEIGKRRVLFEKSGIFASSVTKGRPMTGVL